VFSQIGFSQAVTGGSESFSLVFDITDYGYSGVGNLLVDITIANTTFPGFGFSRSDPGAVFSRAWDGDFSPSPGADGNGLRTQFDVGPATTPEPSSLLLLGAGLTTLSVAMWRRKRG
jgi:hypothetical protein